MQNNLLQFVHTLYPIKTCTTCKLSLAHNSVYFTAVCYLVIVVVLWPGRFVAFIYLGHGNRSHDLQEVWKSDWEWKVMHSLSTSDFNCQRCMIRPIVMRLCPKGQRKGAGCSYTAKLTASPPTASETVAPQCQLWHVS